MAYQLARLQRRRAVVAVIAGAALAAAGCGLSGVPIGGSSQSASGAPFRQGASSGPTAGIKTGQTAGEAGPAGAEASSLGAPAFSSGRTKHAPPSPSPAGMVDSRAGIVGGALFGGDGPLAAVAGRLGRKLAIVRTYYNIGDQFPFPWDAALMAKGTTLLVSLDTHRAGPTYASIAAGREDGAIRPFLAAVERSAVRYNLGAIYVDFEHEADDLPNHRLLGTPAQFVRAWDHIHALAVAAHLDWNQGGRLHWVLILANGGYPSGLANSYWPGAGEVDIVADDGYNTGGCRIARRVGRSFSYGEVPPVSPASLFDPALRYASAHGGLPVFIAEWGSVPYSSPAVRVNWIHQMQNYTAANRNIYAVLYWNDQFTPCNYVLDNYPSSLAALAAMAQSPGMQGRIVSAG